MRCHSYHGTYCLYCQLDVHIAANRHGRYSTTASQYARVVLVSTRTRIERTTSARHGNRESSKRGTSARIMCIHPMAVVDLKPAQRRFGSGKYGIEVHVGLRVVTGREIAACRQLGFLREQSGVFRFSIFHDCSIYEKANKHQSRVASNLVQTPQGHI